MSLAPFNHDKDGWQVKKKLRDIVRTKLERVLDGYGFAAADDGMSYGRVVNGVSQAILITRTRYKDEYVVVCAIDYLDDALSGEAIVASHAHRERLASSQTKFCLSPIAPFQGSYDWTFADELTANRSADEIGGLVQVMCFPVFASLDSRQRLIAASNHQQEERIVRHVCGALSDSLGSYEYQLASDHGFLWKPNGEVNVILLPSVVGFGCFLILYVVLWSPLLMGHGDACSTARQPPPPDFSQVSFATVGQFGITDDGADALWCISDEAGQAAVADKLSEVVTGDSFFRWLSEHQTVDALVELVHPDMRTAVRRLIDNAR